MTKAGTGKENYCGSRQVQILKQKGVRDGYDDRFLVKDEVMDQ